MLGGLIVLFVCVWCSRVRFICNVCGLPVNDCVMLYGLLLCVCVCLCVFKTCLCVVCDVLGGLMLCVKVFVGVCVLCLFNVCALYVYVLSGVVCFVCLYYSLCLCAWLLINACALYEVYCVML